MPEQFSIAGFGNILLSEHCRVPLTPVRQPKFALGNAAATLVGLLAAPIGTLRCGAVIGGASPEAAVLLGGSGAVVAGLFLPFLAYVLNRLPRQEEGRPLALLAGMIVIALLVELSGLRFMEDIKVQFSGTRPGEKLSEKIRRQHQDLNQVEVLVLHLKDLIKMKFIFLVYRRLYIS